jgi:hypothetical protein
MPGAGVSGETLKATSTACRQADNLHMRVRVFLTVCGRTDRKNKSPFRAARWRPPSLTPLYAPPSVPRQPRRNAPQHGIAQQRAVWTGVAGWEGGSCFRGALGRRPREGRFWKAGGKISTGFQRLFRPETPLHCAHVAPETTRDIVG